MPEPKPEDMPPKPHPHPEGFMNSPLLKMLFDLTEKVGKLEGMMEVLMKERKD